MKRSILLMTMVMLFTSLSYGQAWEKIKGVTPTAAEINRVKGVTSDIQTQLNNKFDKSEAVSATSVFYTKTQIDSILNARYGSLKLEGSKLTYAASGKKYTAKTDSIENLGPELVSNGTFVNGTGWDNFYSRFTITGGVAQVNTGSSTYAAFLYQDILIENGKTYKVQVSVTAYTSGNFVIGLNDKSDGVYSTVINGTGNYTFLLTSNMDIPKQVMLQSWNIPFVGSIDNISIREVL